jgi:hypothetical protein
MSEMFYTRSEQTILCQNKLMIIKHQMVHTVLTIQMIKQKYCIHQFGMSINIVKTERKSVILDSYCVGCDWLNVYQWNMFNANKSDFRVKLVHGV